MNSLRRSRKLRLDQHQNNRRRALFRCSQVHRLVHDIGSTTDTKQHQSHKTRHRRIWAKHSKMWPWLWHQQPHVPPIGIQVVYKTHTCAQTRPPQGSHAHQIALAAGVGAAAACAAAPCRGCCRSVSVFGQAAAVIAMLHCDKQLCPYTGSWSSGGGAWPKIMSHDSVSKSGFIVKGSPKSSVKKF